MRLAAYPVHIVPDRAVPSLTWPLAFITPSVGSFVFDGENTAFYFTGRNSIFHLIGEDTVFSFGGKESAFHMVGEDTVFSFEGE